MAADRTDRRDTHRASHRPHPLARSRPRSSSGPDPGRCWWSASSSSPRPACSIGFLLPGDTLLVISGLLSHPSPATPNGIFGLNVWVGRAAIAPRRVHRRRSRLLIGHKGGPGDLRTQGIRPLQRQERRAHQRVLRTASAGSRSSSPASFRSCARSHRSLRASATCRGASYTLYNFIGAMLWGFGLTMFGYLIGFIPPVGDFVDAVHRPDPARRRRRHRHRHRSGTTSASAARPARPPQRATDVDTDADEAQHSCSIPRCSRRGPEHIATHDGERLRADVARAAEVVRTPSRASSSRRAWRSWASKLRFAADLRRRLGSGIRPPPCPREPRASARRSPGGPP